MKTSLIICSYGRPAQLKSCLEALDVGGLSAPGRELVLVYTLDDEATAQVMKDYAATAKFPVKIVRAEKRGLSRARNAGIQFSEGELLIFTDDDCIMMPGYMDKVVAEMSSGAYGYGGGSIHNPYQHKAGTGHVGNRIVIDPGRLLSAGVISGGNMFALKKVFGHIGGFREDMGGSSGTRFVGAEDLEFVTRASLNGYAGILIHDALNTHMHNRPPGSAEEKETGRAYDLARGAHYAWLMMRGSHEGWGMWAGTAAPDHNRQISRETLRRLRQEFEGAYEYLSYCLDNNIDLPPQ